MCGRFTSCATPAQLAEIFAVLRGLDLSPRYDIAPTQTIAAVRAAANAKQHELALLRWGPYPAERLRLVPVSRLVNSPKNDAPQSLSPA
jgi:putative SOS response-associated peptidase YedK